MAELSRQPQQVAAPQPAPAAAANLLGSADALTAFIGSSLPAQSASRTPPVPASAAAPPAAAAAGVANSMAALYNRSAAQPASSAAVASAAPAVPPGSAGVVVPPSGRSGAAASSAAPASAGSAAQQQQQQQQQPRRRSPRDADSNAAGRRQPGQPQPSSSESAEAGADAARLPRLQIVVLEPALNEYQLHQPKASNDKPAALAGTFLEQFKQRESELRLEHGMREYSPHWLMSQLGCNAMRESDSAGSEVCT